MKMTQDMNKRIKVQTESRELQRTSQSVRHFVSAVLSQWGNRQDISFDDLVSAVKNVHQFSYQAAVKAINRYATMRNWLIGFFIVEYQQKGKIRDGKIRILLKSGDHSN